MHMIVVNWGKGNRLFSITLNHLLKLSMGIYAFMIAEQQKAKLVGHIKVQEMGLRTY